MVTIKVRLNGPYLVDGEDVMLVDWNDAPYQIPKRPFALSPQNGSHRVAICSSFSRRRLREAMNWACISLNASCRS